MSSTSSSLIEVLEDTMQDYLARNAKYSINDLLSLIKKKLALMTFEYKKIVPDGGGRIKIYESDGGVVKIPYISLRGQNLNHKTPNAWICLNQNLNYY